MDVRDQEAIDAKMIDLDGPQQNETSVQRDPGSIYGSIESRSSSGENSLVQALCKSGR